MGVQGLWQLLESVGRPVAVESLEGKVLAVDVSIWLYHALKGYREKDGSVVTNAHIILLFNRICKLLYYRIKPIFVFDGGVPELKRQTLVLRREKREDASQRSGKTREKILTNFLKKTAVDTALGGNEKQTLSEVKPSTSKQDLYELPSLPDHENEIETELDQDLWEAKLNQRQCVQSQFQDYDQIDINSEDFKLLPPEIRHEILSDLKDRQKANSWASVDQLPEDSGEFSNFQLTRLLKKSKLSQEIEDVRKEMNTNSSGQLAGGLYDGATEVQARRLLSEESSHFVLVKGLKTDKRTPTLITIEEETSSSGKQSIPEKSISVLNVNSSSKITKKGDYFSESGLSLDKSDDEDSVEHISEYQNNLEMKKNSNINFETEDGFIRDDESTSEDERGEVSLVTLGANSLAQEFDELEKSHKLHVSELPEQNIKTKNSIIEKQQSPCNINTDRSVEPEMVMSSNDADTLAVVFQEAETPEVAKNICFTGKEGASNQLEEDKCSIAREERFAVTVDPDILHEDQLFPASIFSNETPSTDDVPVEVASYSEDRGANTVDVELVTESSEAANIRQQALEESVPTEIFNEFSGMSQSELQGLSEELEMENFMLQQEKGQQERLAVTITDQMYAEAQELLRLFGIPYVVSPMEAEAQCAQLDQANLTSGSITDDSDIWLFGGRYVYKNFFNKDKDVELFKLDDIEKQYGMDKSRLIAVAFICGSDYTEGIFGAGPVTAMEILSEFPAADGIQALKNFKSWWDETRKEIKMPQETKIKSKLRNLVIREGFPSSSVVDAYLNPTVDESEENFSWGTPDLDLIREFTNTKLGWTRMKTDELVLPVMKRLNERQLQKNITSYFASADDETVTSKKLKSKRVQRVINKFTAVESDMTDNNKKKKTAIEKLSAAKPKRGGRKRKVVIAEVKEDSGEDVRCFRGSSTVANSGAPRNIQSETLVRTKKGNDQNSVTNFENYKRDVKTSTITKRSKKNVPNVKKFSRKRLIGELPVSKGRVKNVKCLESEVNLSESSSSDDE